MHGINNGRHRSHDGCMELMMGGMEVMMEA
jgi:hypothetical protein